MCIEHFDNAVNHLINVVYLNYLQRSVNERFRTKQATNRQTGNYIDTQTGKEIGRLTESEAYSYKDKLIY